MTIDNANVIAFTPRRQEVPALQSVELRLDEACGIQMTVYDDTGNVVVILQYDLVAKPIDFDLDRLRAAWEAWRGSSSVAS